LTFRTVAFFMMMTDQSWLKQGVSGIGDEMGVKKEKGS
jgi:hypothetical protein